MKLVRVAISAVALVAALGCAASTPVLTAAGQKVTMKKAEPPDGFIEIGPVTGEHGSGCGGFGAKGTYEGAYADLKNKAGEMGADFVRIDVAEPPHQESGCYDNAYELQGVAFKAK